jgi:hypothetical protein
MVLLSSVLTFTPIDGDEETRSLSGVREHFKLGANDSSYDEGLEMKTFWTNHHPSKKFWLYDPQRRQKSKFKTDSNFPFAYNDQDGSQWNLAIKQAWPYTWVNY